MRSIAPITRCLLCGGCMRCTTAIPMSTSRPRCVTTRSNICWLAILAIGIPGSVVAFHALCVFVAAVATHGNVRWPAWLERALQPAVITLDAHLVHHSADAAEANANF